MKIAIYYNTKTTKSLNVTKDVQDLYTKNYKTLQREVKDNLNKWTIKHADGLQDSTLSNVSSPPNWTTYSQQAKDLELIKPFLKKNKAEVFRLSDFKTYCGKKLSYFTPFLKIISKWVLKVNVGAKSIIHLLKNVEKNICSHGSGQYFLEHRKHKPWKEKTVNELYLNKKLLLFEGYI